MPMPSIPVTFTNGGSSDGVRIKTISATFTYSDGEPSVASQAVDLGPGDSATLHSLKRCVKQVHGSAAFFDGATPIAIIPTASSLKPDGECHSSVVFTITPPNAEAAAALTRLLQPSDADDEGRGLRALAGEEAEPPTARKASTRRASRRGRKKDEKDR